MQKKADWYDKFTWYLMAFSGLAMWILITYALYETFSKGGSPL